MGHLSPSRPLPPPFTTPSSFSLPLFEKVWTHTEHTHTHTMPRSSEMGAVRAKDGAAASSLPRPVAPFLHALPVLGPLIRTVDLACTSYAFVFGCLFLFECALNAVILR